MGLVEYVTCSVWKIRSVENEEVKIENVENEEVENAEWGK